MMRLPAKLHSFLSADSGATAVEYGLLAGLIAATILSALQFIGGGIAETFDTIAQTVIGVL